MEFHRGTKDCLAADSFQSRQAYAATNNKNSTSSIKTKRSKYNNSNKRVKKKRQVHKSPLKMKSNRYKRHFKAKAYQSPLYHKYQKSPASYDSDSSDSIQDSYLNLNFQKNHWKQQSNNTALTSVAGYSMDSYGGISSNSLHVSQIDSFGKRHVVKRMGDNRMSEATSIPYTSSRTTNTASYYPPQDEFLYNLHSIRDRSESLVSQNTEIWTLENNSQSNVLERLMQVLSKGIFCSTCSNKNSENEDGTPSKDLQESFTITERTMTINSEEEEEDSKTTMTAKKKKRGLEEIATVKRNNNSKNSLHSQENEDSCQEYGVSYVNVGELDGEYHDTRDDACSVYSIEYQHCKDLNYTSTLDDSHHALNHVHSMHSLGDVDAMNNHGDSFLSPKGNTQKQLFQEEENNDSQYHGNSNDNDNDEEQDDEVTNNYNFDKNLEYPSKKKKHQRYDSELPLSPMTPTPPLPRGRTGTSSPMPRGVGRPPMISSRMTSYGMQSQSGYMSARERLNTADNQTVCTMNTFHTVNTTGTYHRRTDSSCTFTANSLAMIFHGEQNTNASREREVATTPVKSPTANIIPKTVKTVSKRRNGNEIQDEISPLDNEEGATKSRNYRELLEKYGDNVSEESDYDSSAEKPWNRELKVDLFQNADTPSSIIDSVDGENDDPHSITASDVDSSSHCLSPIDLNKSIPRTKPSSAGMEVALPQSCQEDGVYFPQSKVFSEELQQTDEKPITFEGWVAYSREEGELQQFVQKKNRIKRNHLRYVILKENKLYIRSSRKANGDRDSQSLLSNDKVLKLSTKMNVENEYISKRHGQCITIREPRLISEKGKASDLVCTILPVQLDRSFFKDEECSQLISTDDYKKVRDSIFGKKNGCRKDTIATTTKAYHDKTPYPTRDNSLSFVWPMNIFDTTVPFEQNTTALHIFFALDIAIRHR
ncbi:predicted protein [Chaetoceros tenuissimus]|uniref:Uncharacterized protein n=1 Tax=Chaetoceros tenuissimus TaxID=426638 RepID=A0AAD3CQP2_9STRA|nr:predicted protein [Chaetoceros tenuissimus]